MKLRPAGYAWLGLTVYVITFDGFLIIQEHRGKTNYYTMSTAFREALKHPVKRWPVMVMWFFLTFHLFTFFFPEKVRRFEPIGALGRLAACVFGFKTVSLPVEHHCGHLD